MGSPKQPTNAQIAELEKAGQLQEMGQPLNAFVQNGLLVYNLSLPRQAVALLKIEW